VSISSNSVALNYNYRGSPFVRVPGSNGIDTSTLSYDWRGSPFVAITPTFATITPTLVDINHVDVDLSAPVTVVSWEFLLDGENALVSVETISSTEFRLTTDLLRPGRTYYVRAVYSVGSSGLVPFSIPVSPPWINYNAYPLPFPMKLLESVTYMFGKELQYLGGVPVTHMTENYTALDTVITVKSTLGFQQSGYFYAAGRRFSYTSKTQTAFLGVSGDDVYNNMPKGTKVVFDSKSVLPSEETPGIIVTETFA
jgi:hypothetical protein